ncbi:MAG: hypothetical protein QXJ73_07050 [Candidatus Caldarchaeum sp.]
MRSRTVARDLDYEIRLGLITTICLRRYFSEHMLLSSGVGSLFPGGRHFTTFVMKTSSRLQPASFNASVKSFPDLPTKDLP